MAEKVTTMVLNVDLQCCRCYKKVKKVLCQFPQIRNQMYDEQSNTVTITVVCCNPEKIRNKICCKGGESIKSIEIKPPPKLDKTNQKNDKVNPSTPGGKTNEPEKKPELNNTVTIKVVCCSPEKNKDKICCKGGETIEKPPIPKETEKSEPIGTPIGYCCTECYHGLGGGPCHFGRPPPPPRPCFGRPVYDRCGCGCGGYQYCYASEENPQVCSIM